MNSFLNIQVRILAEQARAQIRAMKGDLKGLGGPSMSLDGFDRMGSRLQWLGRQIEYNFTLPLAVAGAAATKFALDNEAALTRIKKVYGDATHGADFYKKEIQSLQKAFVALSNEFGIAQADALNIAADWAAAGASGLALAKSVELTMKTMILGELDAAKATQSLIAIQAQYGLSVSQLADTIDILNMVENQTGISMAGLIDGFARVAGVARSSGVTVRELAADLAALTPATGSAVNAGNALKTIFSRLLSPTKQTSDVLKEMHINTQSFAFQSANAQQKLIIMAQSFQKLSDAQKGFVSSIIASRYQVNRFEVLMRELANSHGYYQRALQSTSDMNKVYAQSQKELNLVLTSSPRRLQIIWTMLQNAAANIVQPLIPLILSVAAAIEHAVTAFSHLNPGIQKLILAGLLLIAVVGPIVRYIGAFQVLVFELARLLKLLAVPLGLVTGLFKYLLVLPIQYFFMGASLAARGMVVAFLYASKAIPLLLTAMTAVSEAILMDFARVVGFAATAGAAALVNGTTIGLELVSGVWGLAVAGWQKIVAVGMLGINTIYTVGLAALQRALLVFAAFSGVAWRAITTAPLLLLRNFWVAVVSGFRALIPFMLRAGALLLDALTGPIGIAVTVAITLIILFWKQIKQIWNNAIDFFRGNGSGFANAFKPLGDAAMAVVNLVVRAFNALPKGIQSAMKAVVDTVVAAAKAVYQAFSYMNPWAKHSPSLVDNVKTGSEAIKGHYSATQDHANQTKKAAADVNTAHAATNSMSTSTLTAKSSDVMNLGSAFNKAAKDLDIFEAAVQKVQRAADKLKFADIRKDIAKFAPEAIGAFDRLLKELYPLEDQLKKVGAALEKQQAIVDKLKDRLDAANDTLQLQTDILDSIKNSVDDFTDKVNAINGDLEVLAGQREMLRQAGAGSDILKSYDDQINALKDQKKGINDQLDAATAAYDKQKQLVDQLTAARDKLQASYDAEKAKLDDIQDAYDKIKDRIDAITGAINDFASAAQSIKAAQEAAKGSDVHQQFAAGAGANFADVGGSGALGREGGIADQADLIDQFTKDIQKKTQDLFGMFNFLDPIKKAWNKAWDWIKTTFGPLGGMIGDFFGHLFDNVSFGGIGDGGPFKDFLDTLKDMLKFVEGVFKSLWAIIGPPIKQIGKVLLENLGYAWKKISPEIAKFKDLLGPLGQLFKEIWTVVKPLAAILGGALLLAISILASIIANVLGPALHLVIDIIAAVIKILRGLIEFVVGVLTGNWSLAWQGIKDVFMGVWDAIVSIIVNAGKILYGIVKGIVEGIVNFFKWLWDVLVGHSIIPDLVNAIVGWFKFLKDVGVAIWNAFMTGLKWVWDHILKPVIDAIVSAVKGIGSGISAMVDYAKGRWNTFKDNISDAYKKGKEWIDKIVGAINGIKDRIKNAFSGMFDGIKQAFKSAINWIIEKWNNFSIPGVNTHTPLGTLGGFDTPDIKYLARGGVLGRATAIVGEGRKGFPEYVIPTDPIYRTRAIGLFDRLGTALGLKGNSTLQGGGFRQTTVIAPTAQTTELHFHGDLSFPNIKSGNDAEEFVKNLQALVSS